MFSSELAYASHLYAEAPDMWPVILYIPYATSYHEQTGIIITCAQFEERNLAENERNVVEDELILDSID